MVSKQVPWHAHAYSQARTQAPTQKQEVEGEGFFKARREETQRGLSRTGKGRSVGSPRIQCVFGLDVIHGSNPSCWEALMGGHKFESSLDYKGRSCLKGEKGAENGREKEGREKLCAGVENPQGGFPVLAVRARSLDLSKMVLKV